MSEEAKEEAITFVCEIALEWAGEYGYAHPEEATAVWDAVRLLRPDLPEFAKERK